MERQLEMEAFAAVVDQGGFTDAAQSLGVPQSTLSTLVSSLETELGAPLLMRTPLPARPTEIGLVYYERVKQILTPINEPGHQSCDEATENEGVFGNLNISVDSDFGALHLAPVLDQFLTSCPDMSVEMVLTKDVVDLKAGNYDMAIRVGECCQAPLRKRKLATTTHRLVAAPSYIDRNNRPARIADLDEHTLLYLDAPTVDRTWKILSRCGEYRDVGAGHWIGAKDGQSLLNACISGLGIAYLPSYLYRDAMDLGLLEDVIPELPFVVQNIYAAYPPSRQSDPKIAAFLDHVLGSLSGKGPDAW